MTDDMKMVQSARHILHDRSIRYRLFQGELFDECAWNMLLYLFIAHVAEEQVSERHLIASVRTSVSIGQRWLYHLAKDGQVEHRMSGTDVRLTPASLEKLREYVNTVVVS